MTKQILKKWWLWLTVFLVFVLILGALSSEPEPIVAAQVKEIKPPPTASFPKQKYLEETFVADGKVKTFALQNSYKDVTVSLNGEVQVLGVKQEKNIDVVFLDVTPDAQATSKKIQFAEIPPPQSVVTVTGAVFNTEPLKATNTPIITPKSTATPVPTAQQTQSWQTVNSWQGTGEKNLETILFSTRKLAFKISWTNAPEPVYDDDPDFVSPVQAYGIFQCEEDYPYESCGLIVQAFIGTDNPEFLYKLDDIPSAIITRDKALSLKVMAEKGTSWIVELKELK
ncbi:MAG: hypothetical protein A3F15_01975 [Candidatus Wildermuthbacteria bacterium RIFCSPHIGHO2_12_FULL_40_12]|uniref:Uncharacterized protein n=1 Tax=Candidatus Wildermuthbacteria bacterium RIFCSPHIGHO2_12_FULL_40_12 TaxID=1802457 RepID=A0A1G2RBS0_9BACT|nr:MAG: hypothetical protein A3F15_01975 [Candidatus Wildermuthbacteria bacterium RIFCSPHIGHO2_12_FULL_40_12]HXK40682.1 hypothetical protein [Candidatus Paceibacterota bacterium]